jgi:NAD(P)H-dependent flavin oxidoreductase YrpB (nitropropane dioxygenase family)
MSTALLSGLGVTLPVLAAPMAGGPTTPALVTAATAAQGLGFVAGGYLTAAQLDEQLAAVRALPAYGVNLFAPPPVPVDRAAYRRYRDLIRAEADRYGLELPEQPVEDDDHWHDKVDLLLASPPAVVSFTFAVPGRGVVAAFRAAGSLVIQTVTSPPEARQALEAGADALAVQSTAAGGHWGTLTPTAPWPETTLTDLLPAVAAAVDLPLLAAGGIGTPADVVAAVRAGAEAVMVGTALLLAPESGTSAVHRAALLAGDRPTTVTRAFTGRPARGLRTTFLEAYDAEAPSGYPALHHLTSPLRRAAAAAGNPEPVNLWAGTGYRWAVERPAAETLQALGSGL